MKSFLVPFLVCPSCLPEEKPFARVSIDSRDKDDIISGSLECKSCGRTYAIRDGIAFLHPDPYWVPSPSNKYEDPKVVSSYLWGHYGDLMDDDEYLHTYKKWADLMEPFGGLCLDIGCAVGRFSLEMSQKSDFVVGLDLSLAFIKTARQFVRDGHITVDLIEEGTITTRRTIELNPSWQSNNIDFIIADGLKLPFKSDIFLSVSSLNILDKIHSPLKHIIEMDRVASLEKAQSLVSDPFSWSLDASPVEEWLGGKKEGDFSGYGIENVKAIFEGKKNKVLNPWRTLSQGHVWWKLRTHKNHFELIRSLFIKFTR